MDSVVVTRIFVFRGEWSRKKKVSSNLKQIKVGFTAGDFEITRTRSGVILITVVGDGEKIDEESIPHFFWTMMNHSITPSFANWAKVEDN